MSNSENPLNSHPFNGSNIFGWTSFNQAIPSAWQSSPWSDIIWRNHNSSSPDAGKIELWRLNPQTLEREETIALPSETNLNWHIETTGDFNRDGYTDIVWRNYATGANRLWYMQDVQLASVESLIPVTALEWRIDGAGDFNQDGFVDLLWRNYATGDNGVWLMNGSQFSSAIPLPSAGTNWGIGGAQDFNQDGHVDLLWRNYSSGENGIWLMNGLSLQSAILIDPHAVSMDWVIEGTGDFNRDGNTDIFWRRHLTGHNGIWLNNSAMLDGAPDGSMNITYWLTESRPDLTWYTIASFERAAPTLYTSKNSVAENSPGGTLVAELGALAFGGKTNYDFSLLNANQVPFEILDNEIRVVPGALLDFETTNRYTLQIRVSDQGNLDIAMDYTVTLNVTNLPEVPRFTSTPASVATVGVPYQYAITTTDPDGDARTITTVTALPGWLTLVDNGDGTAVLSGTPTVPGLETVTLKVTDAGGLSQIQTLRLGTNFSLQEGSTFQPLRAINFPIPSQPSILQFQIDSLPFDGTDLDSINDAFEVALVDAAGNSLVHTIAPGRNAFFNLTEGEATEARGAGVTYSSQTKTVSLNLTGLEPGTPATLIFRLLNNDGDTTTSVAIKNLTLTPAPLGTVAPVQRNFAPESLSTGLEPAAFSSLSDVSPSLMVEYHQTAFNSDLHLLYTDINLRNTSTQRIDGPLLVAITNISDPSVVLRSPDGYTPDGTPYYNWSNLLGADGKLSASESTSTRSLVFYNPKGVQFTYDVVVLGQANRNPEIITQPLEETPAGKTYIYTVQAIDPDQDTLTYKLLSAPVGMSIDSNTGEIRWTPTTSNIGNHSVLVQVTDDRGGTWEQPYTLSVTDGIPNRPPTITSFPVIEATVKQLYSYQISTADADLDSLTFGIVGNKPAWLTLSSTGLLSGTPSADDVDEDIPIVLQVTDGRGGTQIQTFNLRVNSEPGNVAPRIVSTPIEVAYLPINSADHYTYQVRAIDPNEQDTLQYSLLKKPDNNMSIDPNTGKITWDVTQTAASNSPHEVEVQVKDGRGGVDRQTFFITVPNTQSGTGEIQGTVWTDADGDGVKDADERGMAEVEVYLDLNYNSIFDAGDIKAVTTSDDVSTPDVDEAGRYHFSNLIPKTYTVRQLTPSGFNLTSPAASSRVGANLLHNGSFEEAPVNYNFNYSFQTVHHTPPYSNALGPNEIPGWQVSAGTVDYQSSYVQASNGRATIDLAGNIPGAISQIFETTIGTKYLVSFDLAVHGDAGFGTVYSAIVSADAVEESQSAGEEFFAIKTGDRNNMGYQPHSWQFIAEYTSTKLTFSAGLSNYSDWGAVLDNVIVAPILSDTPDYRRLATVNSGQITRNINFGNQPIPTFAVNHDPEFTSITPATAQVNTLFEYQAKATDSDFNPLRYDLLVKPEGMGIDSTTGLVFWTPTPEQLLQTNNAYLGQGVYNVMLRVQDGQGGIDFQSFNLNVTVPNLPPIFTQLPTHSTIRANTPFSYSLKAEDLDQAPDAPGVNYSLGTSTPSGISINSTTGELTGSFTQLGETTLTVIATDHRGATTLQDLTFKVVDQSTNIAPEIVSTPRTVTRVNAPYFYRPLVVDQDGEATTFQLLNGPQGMTVQNGMITWTPNAAQVGEHSVTLVGSDGILTSVPQSFILTVANQAPNSAPQITPIPNFITSSQNLFASDLEGIDPDGDVTFWSLAQAPSGMTIHPTTGALRWQPTANQIGTHEVVVKLTDAYGLESTQSFRITNNRMNLIPLIQSSPNPQAVANQLYTYQVVAKDPENGNLSYRLAATNLAQGMSIDAKTGTLTWTPSANLIGTTQTVQVLVTDDQGGEITQTYELKVNATAVNQAPKITSSPIFLTATNQPYRYQVVVSDPDVGDHIASYHIISKPTNFGGSINATTGELTWANPQAGSYALVVGVTDTHGATAAQGFTLVVRTNDAPVLQSAQLPTAAPNTPYQFNFKAADANAGDVLTYTLDADSQNKGMQIDASGRFTWTPTLAQLGSSTLSVHPVTVTVTDSLGATDTETFQLTLAKDSVSPQVQVFPSSTSVNPGTTVTFFTQATDNVKVANVTMTVNGIAVPVDAFGRATIDLNQPQWQNMVSLIAQAKAIDTAGNESVIGVSDEVRVVDPRASFNPNLTFDLPDEITNPTDFRVGADGVVGYKLEVAPVQGGEWKVLEQSGSQAISSDAEATFDPSLLQNDTYIAR